MINKLLIIITIDYHLTKHFIRTLAHKMMTTDIKFIHFITLFITLFINEHLKNQFLIVFLIVTSN